MGDSSSIPTELESIGSQFVDPRPAIFQMDPKEASILAQARSLVDWNVRNTFCSICGIRLDSTEAGYKKQCPKDTCLAKLEISNTSYPRTDPVVICLVLDKERKRCLLVRTARYKEGLFSCIAGFLEPGENMEDAVRREVMEEAGVKVGTVIYHSSQPWPFPSQLMLGCIGEADPNDKIEFIDGVSHLVIHLLCNFNRKRKELVDAKWFTKEQARKALHRAPDAEFQVPPKTAIAHTLLSDVSLSKLDTSTSF